MPGSDRSDDFDDFGYDEDFEELLALRDEEAEPLGRGTAIVCRCCWVDEREIEAILAEGGGFDTVVSRTGATTNCGGCEGWVRDLVAAAERK